MKRTKEQLITDIEDYTKLAEDNTKFSEDNTKLAEDNTKLAEHFTKWAEYYTKLAEEDRKELEELEDKELSDNNDILVEMERKLSKLRVAFDFNLELLSEKERKLKESEAVIKEMVKELDFAIKFAENKGMITSEILKGIKLKEQG